MPLPPPLPPPPQESPGRAVLERIVVREELELDHSARLVFPEEGAPLPDTGAPGVVRVVAAGVTVELEGTLRGSVATRAPEHYEGVGLVVLAPSVTVRGGAVSGFRTGILVDAADEVVLEDLDVSDNRRDRLGSTARREDAADWLWPHANDAGEWRARYGAGIAVERSSRVIVRRCRARRGQNGLLLDRVTKSLVYDNDFSFLSGWGIALWRSSENSISRNALDFCVRGYSHGVYNRGQDSAGLLLFEQCSRNLIVENSITHGGDGIFAFSGREALGELAPDPAPETAWYERRGNNGNLIARNDLSYAAAHGLELTFAFDNQVFGNRLVGNAICGLWGGYSRDTLIARNLFASNGDAGYGLERGGIDIEHGQRNVILENRFEENACGVHLFWDEDAGLAELPWVRANGFGSGDNLLVGNQFRGDALGIQLRAAGPTSLAGNAFEEVGEELQADEASPVYRTKSLDTGWEEPELPVFGAAQPIGARDELAGRASIILGPYGPYDYEEPLLLAEERDGVSPSYRALGAALSEIRVEGARADLDGDRLTLSGPIGRATRYHVAALLGDRPVEADGVIVAPEWHVRFFPTTVDPLAEPTTWREPAERAPEQVLRRLDLPFGSGGPASIVDGALEDADHFGTIAVTRVHLPDGAWRLHTVSDDGIRVRIDGHVRIDDRSRHGPTTHDTTFQLETEREVRIEVEHFELDGAATLLVELLPDRG